jgi:hypothetical protein
VTRPAPARWIRLRRGGSPDDRSRAQERHERHQGHEQPNHTADLAAVVGPGAIVTAGGFLRVGDGYTTTLIVTGYPAEVGMAWLEPLLAWAGHLDVAIHIDPLPSDAAASRLRRQRARLESSRRIDANRGRLDDPLIEAAAEDAAGLADRLARGEARLFSVGIYLTVHAPTRALLAEAVAEVRAAAASVLLDTHPATWRQLAGWCSTLPLGHDGLGTRRIMDTDALAASFPLASPDLPGPLPGDPDSGGGVLYGINTTSGGIIWWDRWNLDNHSSVVLARSGAGKSYLVKLDVLRNLYDGVQVAVVDPEDEYTPLAHTVGGTVVRLGAPGMRINPFDLPPGDHRPDALTRRALFLHTLIAVLIGEQPPPHERAALDKAITATYTAAGITPDPATWTRPAPLLRDLAATLTRHAHPDATKDGSRPAHDGDAASTLAARLSPWIDGSFKSLFDGQTTQRPAGHLVVWSTRHLPDELRAAGMLLALDAIWRDVDLPTATTGPNTSWLAGTRRPTRWQANQFGPADGRGRPNQLVPAAPRSANPLAERSLNQPQRQPVAGQSPEPAPSPAVRRLVVVDEAWALMRETEGARFLARMAKSARKRRTGLAVVTQDAADLLGSDLGQVVVANAATQILMRQAPQAIDAVAATFKLTAGEARLLQAAPRGEALLVAGDARIAYRAVASPTEHEAIASRTNLAGIPTGEALDEYDE